MAKKKNAAAVELGRKGGQNSRINLTPTERTELARRAAAARWMSPAAVVGKLHSAIAAMDSSNDTDATRSIDDALGILANAGGGNQQVPITMAERRGFDRQLIGSAAQDLLAAKKSIGSGDRVNARRIVLAVIAKLAPKAE